MDGLSAEERIRRATVPPPGKACAPDPKEAERAKLDARHARNLDFVALASQTVEQASEIAGREWANQRARLHAKSQADMETWLAEQDRVHPGWAAANPCRSRKPQGHAAQSPTGSKHRTPLRDLIFAPRSADESTGEGEGTETPRELAVMMLGLSAYAPA
ncbi:MAG: hypothetical protein QF464_19775, partial [Myxococcota bacterium]|nr:hypothetical protein [Myxococcota bacterium]